MSQVLLLTVAVLLILANAFFVASEFAIVKVRPTRLEELVVGGNRRARLALRISRHLDAYLSANQLGITLASLALGWIGEPAVAELIEPVLTRAGVTSQRTIHGTSLAVSFFVITSLHTIVGELVPKSLAIQRAERMALLTALPLHAFYVLMWPLIVSLNGCANAIVRALGLQPAHESEAHHTSEELRMLLARGTAGIDPELRKMLVRILDLRRRAARHVMTPRVDVVTLPAEASIVAAAGVVGDAEYSRYPVLDASERVLGYVTLRDLFDVIRGKRNARVVAEVLRKPLIARMHTSVETLRRQMQETQVPLSVVVGHDGELVGVVTIEDLVEEIVGEIRDERDQELPPIVRRSAGVLDVDGRVLLEELEREVGIVLHPVIEGVETVGGYVLSRLREPPGLDRHVMCDGYTLLPIDTIGQRVRRIRIVARPSSIPPPSNEP